MCICIDTFAYMHMHICKYTHSHLRFPKAFFFFLKPLLILLQYCFCFTFCFFGHEACGILALRPGIQPTPPALEGDILTSGPPGKSLYCCVHAQLLSCVRLFVTPARGHRLQPARLRCPWGFSRQDTGAGSHALLQGIFPTQGWSPGLPRWGWILYCLSHLSYLSRKGRIVYRR